MPTPEQTHEIRALAKQAARALGPFAFFVDLSDYIFERLSFAVDESNVDDIENEVARAVMEVAA